MSDLVKTAIVLAVTAGLFFWLGVYFAGGRRRDDEETPTEPGPTPAPDPELGALRTKLADAQARAEALEDDLERAREQIPDVGGGDKPTPTAGTETDPELGAIFGSRPADADDLTKIRGVGKALARQLNGLGVYKLGQIAAWEKGQVAAFSSRLSFRDRITRDDWVGQAKRLAR